MPSRRRKEEKPSTKSRFALETLEPDKDLPHGYLSITQVGMYQRCGKQYEYRYIEKKKAPPGVALVEGICHHDAVEMDNEHKFTHGDNLRKEIVVEKFADEFMSKKKEIPKSEWIVAGEDEDDVIDRGIGMLNNYCEQIAGLIIPSHLPERKVEVELGGVPVMAFIDVEDKKSVIDYKVSKVSKSQNDVDNDLQLTICSYGSKKKRVAFCNFTKTKSCAVKVIESQRKQGDYIVADAIIGSVAEAIKAGVFPMCDPANTFPCSPKWCGYWHMCRGKMMKR